MTNRFIHGGRSIAKNDSAPPCDELFILSLPAFRWFRASYSTSFFPRSSHTCHAAKSTNQMLMIGGLGHNDSDMTYADPTNHGIAIFDMTKLAFKNSYQANAPVYEPPEMVQRYYSADRYVFNGSIPTTLLPPLPLFYVSMATLVCIPNSHQKTVRALCYSSKNRYPSLWTSPEVKELFEGPSSSCITTAPTGSCHNTQPGLSNAKIAGLVLGCTGGVFLLILTASVCTFLRKRKIPSRNDDDDDGKINICVGVRELAADQAPQEIMTEWKDRAELSA